MRLLVVSPSKVFWRGVHNALRGLKHITIVECESGVAALKKLRGNRFDMLLLDSGLREMNGLEFLEQFNLLVEEEHRCPLLYFSAQATLDEVLEAVERGIDDFIVMPFDNEVLRKKLDRQVQRAEERAVLRGEPVAELPEGFVSHPQVVPLDDLVPPDTLEEEAAPVAAEAAISSDDADEAHDDDEPRRRRYKRRTTIGM